jgi:methionyl-tRNA formyltransferase
MKNRFVIGYFADGVWSHRALERLLEDQVFDIAFICARFDAPDPLLREMARAKGIPFLVHKNINSDDFFGIVKAFDCDLFVSMSFNQIFRRNIIELPAFKTINCHAGKLPFYRGRNILNWALINDESEFGITVHYVDETVDTGDIISQETYPIYDTDSYGTLLERAYIGCAEVLYKAVRDIYAGTARRVTQASIHPIGFYCSSRRVGDELIEWRLPSRELFNFVRSISHPGPQARTFNGEHELQINRVEMISGAPSYRGIPGSVLQKIGNCFLVKTADSFVRVTEWHSEGSIKVGDRLKNERTNHS